MKKTIVIASEQSERSNPENFRSYGLLRRRCLLAMTGALFLTACAGYKSPSLSGDPSKMSADTLCTRYDGREDSPIGKEIASRNLDCMRVLGADPVYSGSTTSRDLDAAHRIFR
ncbi:MAG TPA: hypothetical protein DEA55_02685 [Rhodospirillaceae bacterium]|nr:hypothetical protein [Rhodospirillaceae bacterium]